MAKQRLVITGVTSGIGLAMSEQFIKMGHTVAGCGRNEEMIDKLRNKYAGDGHLFSIVDISKNDSVKEFAADVLKTIGTPTFLINNAGVIVKPCNLWEVSSETINLLVDINVKGTLHMIQQFVPAMIHQGQGIIVNFSSGWVKKPEKGQGAFCSTKFAIDGMSKCLALDLPTPLACVMLNPAGVNTPNLVTALGEDEAIKFRTPQQWAEQGCPYILTFDRSSNGEWFKTP